MQVIGWWRKTLAAIDPNADMILVYENLLKGSRNHLRAFTSRLTDLGFDYVPVYISQVNYDAIVSSPVETGL